MPSKSALRKFYRSAVSIALSLAVAVITLTAAFVFSALHVMRTAARSVADACQYLADATETTTFTVLDSVNTWIPKE